MTFVVNIFLLSLRLLSLLLLHVDPAVFVVEQAFDSVIRRCRRWVHRARGGLDVRHTGRSTLAATHQHLTIFSLFEGLTTCWRSC